MHKDPKTLMGYVSVSDNSIMEASLTISSAINRVHLNRSSVAGVDLLIKCTFCSFFVLEIARSDITRLYHS